MKITSVGFFILVSAIVWGAVIIGCALVLKGTPYKEQVNHILIGGSTFHLLFIWAPLANQFIIKKIKNKEKSE